MVLVISAKTRFSRRGPASDLSSMGENPPKSWLRMPLSMKKTFFAPDARLADVEISGDRATAALVETRDGQETSEPIEFRKIDGRWKIAALPGISE